MYEYPQRQRKQGYRNRRSCKLWSNKMIPEREQERNENMREHMFEIYSQTLTHIEWVMDRIRAAKLKERKEGQGKVRKQWKEISDTHGAKAVEISSRQAVRAQSAEVVCCRSQERQAGDWVPAIFCHISLSLHPSCLSSTSSCSLTPHSLPQHGSP